MSDYDDYGDQYDNDQYDYGYGGYNHYDDYCDEDNYSDDYEHDDEDLYPSYDESDEYEPDEDEGASPVHRRSSYQPEISPEAIKEIIKEAMAKRNVNEEDIPSETAFSTPENAKYSKRYLEVKGFAWFSCPKRHHRWPSAHSWCFIDLKTQKICYRDTEDCKKCNSHAPPEFTEESIEKMADFVVKLHLKRVGKWHEESNSCTNTKETQGGPHDEKRCGKCRRLGRSCWK